MPCLFRFLPMVLLSTFALVSADAKANYAEHPGAEAFVEKMVKEHGFRAQDVRALLSKAEKKQAILDAISRPAEKTLEWVDYRKIFIREDRIEQGVAFWKTHRDLLHKASETFQVAPEIIVAIIGVETRYGKHKGKYRVIDALATLGFDYPKRGKFFRKQLEEFFLLAREQRQDPTALVGSYAGAMGYGQFIPSSYRAYAVDFDGDEVADIWDNPADAIGSVANYFRAHRWHEGEPIAAPAAFSGDSNAKFFNERGRPSKSLATLKESGLNPISGDFARDEKALPLRLIGKGGPEYWLGFHNFYVITRYNHSHLYAMAVFELSETIKARMAESIRAMEADA